MYLFIYVFIYLYDIKAAGVSKSTAINAQSE